MSENFAIIAVFATIASIAPAAAQSLPGTAEQQEACLADVKANCRFVLPGGGRMVGCVSEKFASFSPRCRQTILQAACGPEADTRLAGRFPCEEQTTPPVEKDAG